MIKEHRYIVEQKIGRPLEKQEIVHHIDNNRSNNNISNLYLCANKSEHSKIHKGLENLGMELLKLGAIEFKDGKYLLILNKVVQYG